ncbi:MAG: hypothetical protein K0S09_1093 [Sphingobacteriaceae bacterium]|jgi:hypothetical protein|nr:hypothetical protein [Sphingobacteriaceae bacterium]
MDFVLWHRDKPIGYFAFGAVFMALLWTLMFKWAKVKELFTEQSSLTNI